MVGGRDDGSEFRDTSDWLGGTGPFDFRSMIAVVVVAGGYLDAYPNIEIDS